VRTAVTSTGGPAGRSGSTGSSVAERVPSARMGIEISCAFATQMATPDHVVLAEELGFRRAWLYDSPALYPDVWVQLCRSAERTSRIGLGPGVLIPSLRHPMTTAAAVATLVALAGEDRINVGVGTGFTGRFTLGQKPLKWAYVAEWVRAVRGLLRGEVVSWEGANMQMLHPPGFGAPRPVDVPFLLGVAGPKGFATAAEVADGVFLGGAAARPDGGRQVLLQFGTVLDDGEPASSDRVIAAAGHGAAVFYHFAHENGLGVEHLPGGPEWLAAYADVPQNVRHLAIHDLHLVEVNERDRPLITGEFIESLGGCYSRARLAEMVAEYEAAGATEVAYQPAGPDIPRELEAFMAAARG
jgi:5,10-methylenetetrahydromethanopterin reductase